MEHAAAKHERLAMRWFHQAAEAFHQRSLAGAVVAKERGDFAGAHLQRNLFEGGLGVVRIAELVQLDAVLHQGLVLGHGHRVLWIDGCNQATTTQMVQ